MKLSVSCVPVIETETIYLKRQSTLENECGLGNEDTAGATKLWILVVMTLNSSLHHAYLLPE